MKNNEEVIEQKRSTTIDNPQFNIVWEGQPANLWHRFLSLLHLNFTWYKISKDELIISQGFFSRRTDSVELYLLKDPDLKETLWQRILGIGTIRIFIDSDSKSTRRGHVIIIKNIRKPHEVRKILRDYIEADVMERGITYFDKV